MTRTSFAESYFDAVACMSVIEHGVPLEACLRKMHRVLKPGGLLITSADYYPKPIDTRGKIAHGAAIKIFTEIRQQSPLRKILHFNLESVRPSLRRCRCWLYQPCSLPYLKTLSSKK